LRNLGGHIRRIHLPQGCGIDEVCVPDNQLVKSRFRAVFNVFMKKLGIRLWRHFIN